MATEESISMEAMDIQGGKITFAPDVIATIASLAANEVEGIDSLGGTVVEGITGMEKIIILKRTLTSLKEEFTEVLTSLSSDKISPQNNI